ncbi:MAG TPA: hypothetical protein VMI32_12985 [Candidatus Solibacter sp.]|nr:hypothetical protein [Candidatus Solibacter sp.]
MPGDTTTPVGGVIAVGAPHRSRRTESPFSNGVGNPLLESVTTLLPAVQVAQAVGSGLTDRAPYLVMSIAPSTPPEDVGEAMVIAPTAVCVVSAIEVAVITTTELLGTLEGATYIAV